MLTQQDEDQDEEEWNPAKASGKIAEVFSRKILSKSPSEIMLVIFDRCLSYEYGHLL